MHCAQHRKEIAILYVEKLRVGGVSALPREASLSSQGPANSRAGTPVSAEQTEVLGCRAGEIREADHECQERAGKKESDQGIEARGSEAQDPNAPGA